MYNMLFECSYTCPDGFDSCKKQNYQPNKLEYSIHSLDLLKREEQEILSSKYANYYFKYSVYIN